MKTRNRLLAMLMAFAMVLAYMPAVTFAESEEPSDADGISTIEEAEKTASEFTKEGRRGDNSEEKIIEALPSEKLSDEAKSAISADEVEKVEMFASRTDYELLYDEWYYSDTKEYDYWLYCGDSDEMRVYTSETAFNTYKFSYDEWGFVNEDDSNDIIYIYPPEEMIISPEDMIPSDEMLFHTTERIKAGESYTYHINVGINEEVFDCEVFLTVTHDDEKDIELIIAKNEAWYELAAIMDQKYPACRDAQKDELDRIYDEAIYQIWDMATSVAAVNAAKNSAKVAIAAVKTDAQLRSEEAARAAAAAAAAAEAARQGAVVGGLPKVKIAKPAAAKGSANIKWKKLTKKQLKGVTDIEVWVCPNTGFGADTIMRLTGKKKASLKVKGLAKGTYYVKVRAINNAGGVKYYTSWSKVKKVKVK